MQISEYTGTDLTDGVSYYFIKQRKKDMILQSKQTTVAYRCPHCGAGVMSVIGLFNLSADMIKLKCDCKQSEMSVVFGKDDNVRLTVPCVTCPNPHRFTVKKSLFFGKDLFTIPCPYSNLNAVVMGESNQVKAELARGELELLDLMEKSGINTPDALQGEEDALPDPQILDIVMFVINDLDAEGKIYCRCDPSENDRKYEAEITRDGICVRCEKCGASRTVPTDSRLGAHAFLNADALHLE